ncbi:type IV pilus biogenesis protein PilP [Maridesulfovibrio sp.]|uniref:type IV pilus biogenesis protein PilP n=1 Tax=Maridesulfovibrio sp. TaxID=2795000 RepID=UPI0029CA489A|nr:type IV pilus biogenesis protein PilP [Maridesulfovibrio sp.]
MRVISLLFLIILVGVFSSNQGFAEDLANLNPEGELLIDVDTVNATNAANATTPANATSAMTQANATNATANSIVANATIIPAFMTGSNSTGEAQPQEASASAENATAEQEQTTKPEAIEQAVQPTPTFARPAVSLGDANYLRSLIAYKKLQVALAKENKKLLELTAPVPTPTEPLSSKSTTKKKHRPTWPKIVSIQGVDGRLSATLSSSAGIETVRVGSNAGPGKVISITPNKVLVRSSGKNIALKFKE